MNSWVFFKCEIEKLKLAKITKRGFLSKNFSVHCNILSYTYVIQVFENFLHSPLIFVFTSVLVEWQFRSWGFFKILSYRYLFDWFYRFDLQLNHLHIICNSCFDVMLDISATHRLNKMSPSIEPWGTPYLAVRKDEQYQSICTKS